MNKNYNKILKNTLEECPDRVESLRKYYPFFYMAKYKSRDESFKDINMGEICLSIISFMFYENKLKNRTIYFDNIKEFISMVINELYNINMNEELLHKFTVDFLDLLQGENGGGHEFIMPHFEKNKGNKKVKYIETVSDVDSGRKCYCVTSSAIDLLLSTKEFAEESKITISLLLLKKLITDSEFDSALLSLTQVNSEVIKQIAKVYEIELGLMYGGKNGYDAFLEYRKAADKRQTEEEELFKQTMEEVRTLREDFASKVKKSELGEKEKNAFRCLDEMDKELNRTIELHQQLLGKVVLLSKKATEILKQKRINILRPSFDFSIYLDRLGKFGSSENLHHALTPFLPIKIHKMFSIKNLNDMFLISPSNEEAAYNQVIEDEPIVIDTGKFNRLIRERVTHNYKYVVSYLYSILESSECVKLSEVIEHAEKEQIEDVFKNPDFAGIILDFIRSENKGEVINATDLKKKKKREDSEESDIDILAISIKEIKSLYGYNFDIKIEPIKDSKIEIAPGFYITNAYIKRVISKREEV